MITSPPTGSAYWYTHTTTWREQIVSAVRCRHRAHHTNRSHRSDRCAGAVFVTARHRGAVQHSGRAAGCGDRRISSRHRIARRVRRSRHRHGAIAGRERIADTGPRTGSDARKTLVRAVSASGGFRLEIRAVSEFVSAQAERPRVESPKYQAPLLDTAQTIAMIPREVIEQQAATSLREVLRDTPGITMGIGEGNSGTTAAGDNVFIRGFNARNDIYIDGSRDPRRSQPRHVQHRIGGDCQGTDVRNRWPRRTGGSINLVSKIRQPAGRDGGPGHGGQRRARARDRSTSTTS